MRRKVEFQKGPIKVDNPTMLTSSHSERVSQDSEMRHERYEGQTLSLHVPKK